MPSDIHQDRRYNMERSRETCGPNRRSLHCSARSLRMPASGHRTAIEAQFLQLGVCSDDSRAVQKHENRSRAESNGWYLSEAFSICQPARTRPIMNNRIKITPTNDIRDVFAATAEQAGREVDKRL